MKRVILTLILLLSGLHAQKLRVGWYPRAPYQMAQGFPNLVNPKGFDVELLRHYAHEAGHSLEFVKMPFDKQLQALGNNQIDLMMAVTHSEERAKHGQFSKPYRQEVNSIFINRDKILESYIHNIDLLQHKIENNMLRLSAKKGALYASQTLNDLLQNEALRNKLTFNQTDVANLTSLLKGDTDAFVADRVVGAHLLWQTGQLDTVYESLLHFKTPVHLYFAKQVPQEVVNSFNQVIEKQTRLENRNDIARQHLLPVMMLQTVNQPWFWVIDFIGVLAFALSGFLVAYMARATLMNAIVLSALPPLGGMVLRDIILGKTPNTLISSPTYIGVVLTVVFIGYALSVAETTLHHMEENIRSRRRVRFYQVMIEIFDAIGLAAFTIGGVFMSVVMQLDPLWLWGGVFAAITGAGGIYLRNIVCHDPHMHNQHIFAEIPFGWGFVLSAYLSFLGTKIAINHDDIFLAVIGTICGVILSRLIVIQQNIRAPRLKAPLVD